MLSDRKKVKKRRVHLYFNPNDEMIEKEDEDSEEADQNSQETSPRERNQSSAVDAIELQKKLEEHEYSAKITVNLGSEEYRKGKQQITKEVF